MKAAKKRTWRDPNVSPRLRDEMDEFAAGGYLRALVLAAQRADLVVPLEDLEQLATASRAYAHAEQSGMDPAKLCRLRIDSRERREYEQDGIAFVQSVAYQRWAGAPAEDKAAIERSAREQLEREHAAFIERRTAEILKAQDEARIAHARGAAEAEWRRIRDGESPNNTITHTQLIGVRQ